MPNIIRNHRSSALTLAALTLVLAAGNVCPGQEKTAAPAPEAAAGNDARNDRLAWFREARFGVLVQRELDRSRGWPSESVVGLTLASS